MKTKADKPVKTKTGDIVRLIGEALYWASRR